MKKNADNDGLGDACDDCLDVDDDNCPSTPNSNQEDADNDDAGDVCDVCPNDQTNDGSDGDGICDDVDNCIGTSNPGQENVDSDGDGDVCDSDTIYGTISGDIQEGVTVDLYILNCGGNLVAGSPVTNSEGYYAIGDLADDRYFVVPEEEVGYSFSSGYWVDIPNGPGQSYDFTSTSD